MRYQLSSTGDGSFEAVKASLAAIDLEPGDVEFVEVKISTDESDVTDETPWVTTDETTVQDTVTATDGGLVDFVDTHEIETRLETKQAKIDDWRDDPDQTTFDEIVPEPFTDLNDYDRFLRLARRRLGQDWERPGRHSPGSGPSPGDIDFFEGERQKGAINPNTKKAAFYRAIKNDWKTTAELHDTVDVDSSKAEISALMANGFYDHGTIERRERGDVLEHRLTRIGEEGLRRGRTLES